MSEERTKDLNVDSTNPLPFEALVTSQLEAIVARLERFETETRERLTQLRVELDGQLTQLRTEMNDRFALVDERFAQIDERFAQIDERFAQIDERLAQTGAQNGQIFAELRTMNAAIERIAKHLTNLDYKVDSFILEQIEMKRDLFKVQEAVGFEPGIARN